MEVSMNFEFTEDQGVAIFLLIVSLLGFIPEYLRLVLEGEDSFSLTTAFFALMGVLFFGASIFIWYVPASIFAISVVCIFIIKSIINKYKLKHPEKYFGGTAYTVDLYSITSNVKAYIDKSKRESIKKSEITMINTLIVQKTYNSQYVREIVTGCIIPVSNINKPSHCVFVSFEKAACKESSSDELERYIKSHSEQYNGYSSFKDYIISVMHKGEEYYNINLEKGEISEEAKRENILKNLNKKR